MVDAHPESRTAAHWRRGHTPGAQHESAVARDRTSDPVGEAEPCLAGPLHPALRGSTPIMYALIPRTHKFVLRRYRCGGSDDHAAVSWACTYLLNGAAERASVPCGRSLTGDPVLLRSLSKH